MVDGRISPPKKSQESRLRKSSHAISDYRRIPRVVLYVYMRRGKWGMCRERRG